MTHWTKSEHGDAAIPAVLAVLGLTACLSGCANSLMTVIPGRLYRSGQLSSDDLARACREHGIKTIINLRSSESSVARAEAVAEPMGVQVVHLPLHQNVPPTDEDQRVFYGLMDAPESYPVLIHCAHGKDRTGMMVAMYRIQYQDWPPKKAYKEMERCGHSPWLFGNLKPFVLGYGQTDDRDADAPCAQPDAPPTRTGGPPTQATGPNRRTTRWAEGRPTRTFETAEWTPVE